MYQSIKMKLKKQLESWKILKHQEKLELQAS